MAVQDLTTVGTRFNFLTITGNPYRKPGGTVWYVECCCDCGTTKDLICKHIVSGHTKSCGCFNLKMERVGRVTHGQSKTGTYRSWTAMQTRCHNPNSKYYAQYGGRGIKVCDRWRSSFEDFLADMGERPEGMTLDRFPNVDGDYEPGNCRWATTEQQANNRQDSVYLEHDGRRMTISQWSRETGFGLGTISVRLKAGWSVEDTLTIPPERGRNQTFR
jgi:hypothetical protein